MSSGTALAGALVRLRAPQPTDAPLFARWFSDPELIHWLHISEGPPVTEESWLKAYEAGENNPEVVIWIIETPDGLPIGHLGLSHVDPIHFRAELFISISEKDYWAKGYGSDAIRQVLRYGFEELHLRRIELITDIDNGRGIRCYEKCGFVREGILRQHRLRHGQPLDMLQMAVLRDEWEE